MTDFFNKELSQVYDEKNRRLAPISEAMHFLVRLILKDLASPANILCVGVGTGAEILSLSKEYTEWSFVGVDPSQHMLEVCDDRLKKAGVRDRCRLIHGHVHDVPDGEHFDAALSILVGHFVKRAERPEFYQAMQRRLRTGGYLVNTEISFDLNAPAFPCMLENWKAVQSLMGATSQALQSLEQGLRDTLCVLAPSEVESLIRASGIKVPVRFFQALMIAGWYGKK